VITLSSLADATPQQVFDQVALHLLTQNKRSMDEHLDACVYRSGEGSKCAAGCLIGDDEYSEDFEFNGWRELVLQGLVPEAHSFLVFALQQVHDCNVPVTWKERLLSVSRSFGLSSVIVEEFADAQTL
jgi:hypothetical protein